MAKDGLAVFQASEKQRLRNYAHDAWGIDGHVLPYELASATLHEDVRTTALEYFRVHQIKWWTSGWDDRTDEQDPRPTGHLTSSQVACVNHLEPARIDRDIAAQMLSNLGGKVRPVSVEDGFVGYEWIGRSPYLGEIGHRTRGAHITSLDAIMCAEREGHRSLLALEWKYLESYGSESVAISHRGTDRVATYRPLLERPDCPISVANVGWLFYEPYYQLMRQTLLAWQMVERGEFNATDWLHVLVIPGGNTALRQSRTAPELPGSTLVEKWRSVLDDPNRFRVVTPSELLRGVGTQGRWSPWRQWLQQRYQT